MTQNKEALEALGYLYAHAHTNAKIRPNERARLIAEVSKAEETIRQALEQAQELQREKRLAQVNFEHYFNRYITVTGKSISEAEKEWSRATNEGQEFPSILKAQESEYLIDGLMQTIESQKQTFDALAKIAKQDEAAQSWQPIETAPKDGRAMLALGDDGCVYQVKWMNEFAPQYGLKQGSCGFYCYNTDQPIVYLAHWMTLPAAPAIKRATTNLKEK